MAEEENKTGKEHGATAATSTDKTSAGNVTGTPADDGPKAAGTETATASAASGRKARASKKGDQGKVEAAGGREITEANNPADANAVARQQREEKTGQTEQPHEDYVPPHLLPRKAPATAAAPSAKTAAPGTTAATAAPNTKESARKSTAPAARKTAAKTSAKKAASKK